MRYIVLYAALGMICGGCSSETEAPPEYKWVDTGVVDNATFGKGIEIRVAADRVADGGLAGERIMADAKKVCDSLAAQAIPFVQSKLDIPEPKYLAIRITISSGFIGKFFLNRYEIDENNTCGAPLN